MGRYSYPGAMRRLINELSKLPSIGEKSASRLAYFLLIAENDQALQLAQTLIEAKQSIRFCERCFSLAEEPLCEVCSDASRDARTVCVVEKPVDVVAIERSGSYRGVYHVLHGLWSPLKGIGPEKTKIPQLISRIKGSLTEHPIEEIVLATGTTVEGDATALYIADLFGASDGERKKQTSEHGGKRSWHSAISESRAAVLLLGPKKRSSSFVF